MIRSSAYESILLLENRIQIPHPVKYANNQQSCPRRTLENDVAGKPADRMRSNSPKPPAAKCPLAPDSRRARRQFKLQLCLPYKTLAGGQAAFRQVARDFDQAPRAPAASCESSASRPALPHLVCIARHSRFSRRRADPIPISLRQLHARAVLQPLSNTCSSSWRGARLPQTKKTGNACAIARPDRLLATAVWGRPLTAEPILRR